MTDIINNSLALKQRCCPSPDGSGILLNLRGFENLVGLKDKAHSRISFKKSESLKKKPDISTGLILS